MCELSLCQTEQVINLGIHILQSEVKLSRLNTVHLCISALFGGTIARLLCSEVFWVATDHPGFSPVGEGEFHPGFCFSGCVVGTEGFAFAALLATGGFTVEGKADRVKDGGFARTGIARNQKETVFPQPREVDLRHASVGTKGGHGKLNGLHRAPPPVL